MKTIQLDTYNIQVGNVGTSLPAFLKERQFSKIFILVDDNTEKMCLPVLLEKTQLENFHLISIPSGEKHKNIETCQQIWSKMMDSAADRNALTINLGGGVIGDMGGFCAATFKRGMSFIQIPTTVLSQVDASIGGKLGIDFELVKNSIGLFKNPEAVLIDPDFLKTLPKNELRSGFAEILKHSLIADFEQWDQLSKIDNLDQVDWTALIIPSLKIKRDIVDQDPFEKGIRKALNFGHTIGHAVESNLLESETPLLHGEAIAIGMVTEAYLSRESVGLTEKDCKKITEFILKIYGKPKIDRGSYPELIAIMRNDKKNRGDEINFTMLDQPGTALINQTATPENIMESLDFYSQF